MITSWHVLRGALHALLLVVLLPKLAWTMFYGHGARETGWWSTLRFMLGRLPTWGEHAIPRALWHLIALIAAAEEHIEYAQPDPGER